MGDPKASMKSYDTPSHPWNATRIDEEKVLTKEYGLVNKKELWKMTSALKKFSDQAKRLITASGTQAEKERAQLLAKLTSIGILGTDATLDSILSLHARDLLERRLQTVVYKKGFSRSIKQSRQFITHNHIIVNGKKVSVPSYIVKINEESTIEFTPKSTLADPEHPERKIESESKVKKETAKDVAEEAKKAAEELEKPKVEVVDAEVVEEPKEEPKEEVKEEIKEKTKEEKKKESAPEVAKEPVVEEPKEVETTSEVVDSKEKSE